MSPPFTQPLVNNSDIASQSMMFPDVSQWQGPHTAPNPEQDYILNLNPLANQLGNLDGNFYANQLGNLQGNLHENLHDNQYGNQTQYSSWDASQD